MNYVKIINDIKDLQFAIGSILLRIEEIEIRIGEIERHVGKRKPSQEKIDKLKLKKRRDENRINKNANRNKR
jgi:hypothetical protein